MARTPRRPDLPEAGDPIADAVVPGGGRVARGGVTWFTSSPLRIGFLATIGVLLALVLGAAVSQIASILTLVFLALFVSLGLYPVVTWLQRKGLPKGASILLVLFAFLLIVAAMMLLIVPTVIDQATALIQALPGYIIDVEQQGWFRDLDDQFNGYPLLLLEWIRTSSADPQVWLAIGGGALHIVSGVLNASVSALLVVVMTLYFVASLDAMKNALFDLVPGSSRAEFEPIAEEIFDSIGKYLSGQVVIASLNAVFSLILLMVMGVPYAGILAFVALVITLIPVIGSVISTTLMVSVSLLVSPTTAIVVGIVMIVYMQLEAYVITPRIIGKAISIPAAFVLIGAVIGGTLLGLLGALVASPVVASILLIIKKVYVPRQRMK